MSTSRRHGVIKLTKRNLCAINLMVSEEQKVRDKKVKKDVKLNEFKQNKISLA